MTTQKVLLQVRTIFARAYPFWRVAIIQIEEDRARTVSLGSLLKESQIALRLCLSNCMLFYDLLPKVLRNTDCGLSNVNVYYICHEWAIISGREGAEMV
jgi:hypothetical protein